MTAPADLGSSLFGGRYAIGGVLGVGASASVYEAEDTGAAPGEGRVAVKILHPHLADRPPVRAAFLSEAARVQGLRHPNVVAVRGRGLHDAGGVPLAWIALDLVDGPSLADLVAGHGRLTVAEAGAVLEGTLAALGAAHALGLVHRDVNPRNILLAREADDPISASQVRVLDFGLADAVGGTTVGGDILLAGTQEAGTGVVGSAAYMSPEQARGLPITEAGDLYQAGAVLYFLLTGQQPYPRESARQVLAAHVSAPPPVPSALVSSASALDRVVTRAMAKEPSRRYPDAYGFRDAIRGALASARISGEGRHQATRVIEPAGPAWLPATPPASGRVVDAGTGRFPVPSVTAERSPAAALAVAGIAAVAVIAVATAILGGNRTVAGALAGVPPTETPAAATPTPSRNVQPSPGPSRPVLVEVPALYGTIGDARGELRAVGLRLGAVSRVDSPQPDGTIIEQSPDTGVQVAWGTVVKVKVASGTNTVPVVSGLGYDEAMAVLRAAGFTSRDVPAEGATVVDSMPAAGSRTPVGTAVALTWSGGAQATPGPGADTASPSPSRPGG